MEKHISNGSKSVTCQTVCAFIFVSCQKSISIYVFIMSNSMCIYFFGIGQTVCAFIFVSCQKYGFCFWYSKTVKLVVAKQCGKVKRQERIECGKVKRQERIEHMTSMCDLFGVIMFCVFYPQMTETASHLYLTSSHERSCRRFRLLLLNFLSNIRHSVILVYLHTQKCPTFQVGLATELDSAVKTL